METAAATGAAAAANEAALAASVAAAEAAKDAVAAAATAKEATSAVKESAAALSAKEPAATASAAAIDAKEAAVKASAAALDAKEAAAVAATAGDVAAAAMHASKKRKFHLVGDGQDPPGNGDVSDGGSVDFISRIPDEVLCSIISLLPTKEGARTQVISHRWRQLWRSAPLNLAVTMNLIQKILAQHPGPGRRFSFGITISYSDKVEGWLSSQALDNLQELEITHNFLQKLYLLPMSVYRFAPTLRLAKFFGCHFTDLIVPLSLKFPCLKQLTMEKSTISEDALQSFLSGCLSLESLELKTTSGTRRLCISSQTLKSLGLCSGWLNEGVFLQELVIEDAPCLERLLPLDPEYGPATIRIISAPKLKILGMISEGISELQFGTTVFQKMIAVGLTTKVHTMRVLVLKSVGPNLDAVVDFLKCFPCLERLYVIFHPRMVMNNVRKYGPLDPIECLELHLKKVVLKNYDGAKSSASHFAKFFVLNAKVLKEMKITLPYHRQDKWFVNQHRLLKIEDRASRDALIELKCGRDDDFTHNKSAHDLSMADPFNGMPSSRCRVCHRCPF